MSRQTKYKDKAKRQIQHLAICNHAQVEEGVLVLALHQKASQEGARVPQDRAMCAHLRAIFAHKGHIREVFVSQ